MAATVDVSRKLNDKTVFIFRQCPPETQEWAVLSFHESNKMRFLSSTDNFMLSDGIDRILNAADATKTISYYWKAKQWTLSGVPFSLLIAPILASYFGTFALMHLLLSIGTMQLEASFDQLHPKLAEIGLQRFLSIAHMTRLPLSSAALTKFNRAWNLGLTQYRTMQRELASIQLLCLVLHRRQERK